MKNKSLHAAKAAKNDEFFTRLEDIEDEISQHPDYVRHFSFDISKWGGSGDK